VHYGALALSGGIDCHQSFHGLHGFEQGPTGFPIAAVLGKYFLETGRLGTR